MEKKTSILLIEDNEADYILTREMLDRRKFSLTWAQTLADGLKIFQNEPTDIILLDLGVPDSVGIVTFDKLRKQIERMPAVIVLTGNDDEEIAKEALARGAQDYLVKGDSSPELLNRSIRYALERHNCDRQLRESNEQLLLLNEQLKATRDEALAACRLKSEFVANISHELRTPLAGVLGMIEIVYDGMSDEDQKELLQVAKESGQHLLSIFNDLLDFSKMEAGYMRLRETAFDPKEAIKSVLDLMTSMAHKKNIFLLSEVEPELPILYGDGSKLRQILLNLLGNAIKFTSEGGTKIQASLGDSTDGVITVQFAVSDTGIGISPSERKHLFEPFSQVDNSSTRKYGGTGLGLAISKGLVELMGGRIGLSSIKGKGSTFFFSIPFHVADERTGGSSVPAPAEDKLNFCPILNGDILVVEDNAVLQMLRKRQLENFGFQVDIVANGKLAVRAAIERSYGVILMDLQLPEMDGYQAAEEIRRLQKSSGLRTPIIAITASMDPQEQQRCTAFDIDELLRKPVSAELLATTLAKWIDFPKESADTKMHSSDLLFD